MYCTVEDLLQQSSEEFLLKCAADPDTNELDEAVAQQKIIDAQTEIDAYCQAQYPVPFAPVPGIIRKLAVDIALYNLLSKHGYDEEDADVIIVKRYQSAIRLLESLAKGTVKLGEAAAGGGANLLAPQAAFQNPPRVFSRSSMRGY